MAEKRLVVFISGRITGDSHYKEKFAEAEAKLWKAQFIPLHSAELPIGLTEGDYMKISLAMLDAADAIFHLPDWEDSRGAMIETSMAIKSGKKFVREEPDGTFTVSG